MDGHAPEMIAIKYPVPEQGNYDQKGFFRVINIQFSDAYRANPRTYFSSLPASEATDILHDYDNGKDSFAGLSTTVNAKRTLNQLRRVENGSPSDEQTQETKFMRQFVMFKNYHETLDLIKQLKHELGPQLRAEDISKSLTISTQPQGFDEQGYYKGYSPQELAQRRRTIAQRLVNISNYQGYKDLVAGQTSDAQRPDVNRDTLTDIRALQKAFAPEIESIKRDSRSVLHAEEREAGIEPAEAYKRLKQNIDDKWNTDSDKPADAVKYWFQQRSSDETFAIMKDFVAVMQEAERSNNTGLYSSFADLNSRTKLGFDAINSVLLDKLGNKQNPQYNSEIGFIDPQLTKALITLNETQSWWQDRPTGVSKLFHKNDPEVDQLLTIKRDLANLELQSMASSATTVKTKR